MGRTLLAACLAVSLSIGTWAIVAAPAGPRSLRRFEPHRLASLELEMWKAYYAKERLRLFGLLVTMLREQHGYSWATATKEGFHLARAAATFGDARGDYDRVLPDLEAGYRVARDWLSAGFDPARLARAELAWWVARRIPSERDPANVGALMADAYAELYGVPRERVLDAAVLRAEAGALRDRQSEAPNWSAIGGMLDESYTRLRHALDR